MSDKTASLFEAAAQRLLKSKAPTSSLAHGAVGGVLGLATSRLHMNRHAGIKELRTVLEGARTEANTVLGTKAKDLGEYASLLRKPMNTPGLGPNGRAAVEEHRQNALTVFGEMRGAQLGLVKTHVGAGAGVGHAIGKWREARHGARVTRLADKLEGATLAGLGAGTGAALLHAHKHKKAALEKEAFIGTAAGVGAAGVAAYAGARAVGRALPWAAVRTFPRAVGQTMTNVSERLLARRSAGQLAGHTTLPTLMGGGAEHTVAANLHPGIPGWNAARRNMVGEAQAAAKKKALDTASAAGRDVNLAQPLAAHTPGPVPAPARPVGVHGTTTVGAPAAPAAAEAGAAAKAPGAASEIDDAVAGLPEHLQGVARDAHGWGLSAATIKSFAPAAALYFGGKAVPAAIDYSKYMMPAAAGVAAGGAVGMMSRRPHDG